MASQCQPLVGGGGVDFHIGSDILIGNFVVRVVAELIRPGSKELSN